MNSASNPLTNGAKWWLLWGAASPVLVILAFVCAVKLHPYMVAIFEFLPPAFFGLWILDRAKFWTNSLKLMFLLTILISLIFVFGQFAMAIGAFVVLLVALQIGFSRRELAWSIGLMVLYGILGVIPILAFFYFYPQNLSGMDALYKIVGSLSALFLLGYFVRGAIFGAILQVLHKKYIG
ncbi:MAG: hypothetical protein PHE67_03895 [Campylobacterales bacterium]|nr:hypothetical protein [Campylobacterales bacterium]